MGFIDWYLIKEVETNENDIEVLFADFNKKIEAIFNTLTNAFTKSLNRKDQTIYGLKSQLRKDVSPMIPATEAVEILQKIAEAGGKRGLILAIDKLLNEAIGTIKRPSIDPLGRGPSFQDAPMQSPARISAGDPRAAQAAFPGSFETGELERIGTRPEGTPVHRVEDALNSYKYKIMRLAKELQDNVLRASLGGIQSGIEGLHGGQERQLERFKNSLRSQLAWHKRQIKQGQQSVRRDVVLSKEAIRDMIGNMISNAAKQAGIERDDINKHLKDLPQSLEKNLQSTIRQELASRKLPIGGEDKALTGLQQLLNLTRSVRDQKLRISSIDRKEIKVDTDKPNKFINNIIDIAKNKDSRFNIHYISPKTNREKEIEIDLGGDSATLSDKITNLKRKLIGEYKPVIPKAKTKDIELYHDKYSKELRDKIVALSLSKPRPNNIDIVKILKNNKLIDKLSQEELGNIQRAEGEIRNNPKIYRGKPHTP